ncbi:MAG: hypothetical protein LBC53_03680 [Spirochaetaceae bacterium]|nr:hypothetical protein [Spirochaetaceae bacterium]
MIGAALKNRRRNAPAASAAFAPGEGGFRPAGGGGGLVSAMLRKAAVSGCGERRGRFTWSKG